MEKTIRNAQPTLIGIENKEEALGRVFKRVGRFLDGEELSLDPQGPGRKKERKKRKKKQQLGVVVLGNNPEQQVEGPRTAKW